VSLDDLSDVTSTSPQINESIFYNTVTNSWENRLKNTNNKNILNLSWNVSSFALTKSNCIDNEVLVETHRAANLSLTLTLPDLDLLKANDIIRIKPQYPGVTIVFTGHDVSADYIYTQNSGALGSLTVVTNNYDYITLRVINNSSTATPFKMWYAEVSYPKPLIETGNTSVATSDSGSDGTITFTTENSSRWEITSSGHILPSTTEDYDIGSADKKVRHLFLSDNSVKFASGDLGVNTGGDLTFTKTGEAALPLATQAYADSSGGPQVLDIAVHRNNLSLTNFHMSGQWGNLKRDLLFRDFQGDTSYPDADYVHNSISGTTLGTTSDLENTAYKLPVGTYLIEVHLAIAPHSTFLDSNSSNNNNLLLSRTIEKFAGSGTLTIHSSNVRFYRQDYEMLQGFNPTSTTIGNDSIYYSGALFHLKIKSKITIATASMALYFNMSDIFSLYSYNRVYSAEYKATKV